MAIVTTTEIGQSFGDVDLFRNVTVSVEADSKIALVGPNGVGKTTLLQIMAGMAQPTTGKAAIAQRTRVGYLRQEALRAFTERGNGLYAEMMTAFAAVQAQEARMHEIEVLMGEGHFEDALMEEYGTLQEQFEAAGGYDYEYRIKQVLQGLGFDESSWATPLAQLSGGQQTRALLARLLLEKPDLLILDEPTNHLDVEALEWLEQMLRNWEGAVLIVSHDRYFLDKVVNTVWEMSKIGVVTYRGNYSAYLKQRQERWERHQKTYEEEKARLEAEMDYIRVNISNRNPELAQGKLKRVTRDLVAIEQVGLMRFRDKSWSEMGLGRQRSMTVEEAGRAVRSLKGPDDDLPKLNMRLQSSHKGEQIVLRATPLQIGYPGKRLFSTDQIELHRLEVAALIGSNGVGKTTFLRTIMGQVEPLAGNLKPGENVKIGYFAQAHDSLNPENTVLDELLRHKELPMPDARKHLAQFLFRKDSVFKQISMLSGGERGRLALAILALEGANFLLLDEPTNHLDIPAQEVLQEVLENFEGTILLVSHDRYLVDRLATQIWNLEGGHLQVFDGDYQQFLTSRNLEAQPAR
ncbi:MAG TPA: ABC-F family ATP-binding cassette domain-containing protein [Aggregatilineales bacterium]|nr:ABC-F family ATP-binding cassette domain-containing protein [Aggregatilineales bacterium]